MEKPNKKKVSMPLTEAEQNVHAAVKAFDEVERDIHETEADIAELRKHIEAATLAIKQKEAALQTKVSGIDRNVLEHQLGELRIQLLQLETKLKQYSFEVGDLRDEGEEIVNYVEKVENEERRRLN